MSDLVKQLIKGYELEEVLGEGGFGAVYRAYQPLVKREVAIKVIRSSISPGELSERFVREARALRGIDDDLAILDGDCIAQVTRHHEDDPGELHEGIVANHADSYRLPESSRAIENSGLQFATGTEIGKRTRVRSNV